MKKQRRKPDFELQKIDLSNSVRRLHGARAIDKDARS